MRIEPKLIDARTEPRLNDNSLVLWLNDNGKTNSMWRDYSGKNNHGTIYGAGTPPPATPGVLGYTFDGIDDSIQHSAFSEFSLLRNFSVSLWIKPSNITANTQILNNVINASNTLAITILNSVVRCGCYNGTDYLGIRSGTITIDVWNNIIYSFDSNNFNNSFLLINGVSKAGVNGAATATTQSFYLGARTNGTNFFVGLINDVRGYSTNISLEMAKQIFNLERGKYGV